MDFFFQVSIVPRTNATLGYAQYLPSDNKLYSTEQVRNNTVLAMSGVTGFSICINRL